MRAVEIGDGFGLDKLRTVRRSAAAVGPGEVRVALRRASLNYRDLLMVRGQYNPRQPLPLIPCSDGVGEIVEIGRDVQLHKNGDRVMTLFAQGWIDGDPTPERVGRTLGGPLDGTLCQSIVLPEHGVVKTPDYLTDDEAATLPCAALTAWSALTGSDPSVNGRTIVVEGTGGVSLFALQLGVHLGARVWVTSSSDAKLERAREFGASYTVNYREQPDWSKFVKETTDGRGVDQVIEVGGAETLPQALRSVRMGGTISLIGNLTGLVTELNLAPILMRQVRVQGIFVGHRAQFVAMNRTLEEAQLRPVVDRTFSLNDCVAAFEHMAAGRHFGKITVDLSDKP
ncbi:MAG: NAD(P)-dependent alcohol dehydrogenase [Acidobacteriota bacterium]|nr:NAD(P)-dependent alcohol dehydrogenase [Acidobacteriota bacterium]MDH3785042.1 NAD(P)-dependent alcohol dehydrogenase [Acidobacteriota bacterium]